MFAGTGVLGLQGLHQAPDALHEDSLRLLDVNAAADARAASYAYDYRGRRISRTIYGSPNVTIRYAYDVFGRPTIRDPNGVALAASARGNPYLFTARAYDAESGVYYCRARYYDYATGRFLQPDPLGYADGINWYLYCANNPILFIDPWGFCRGVGAARTTYKIWEAIGDIAGVLYALKEVSDIFEVKAGLALGLNGKVKIGPMKGEAGFSLTSDALKVEQSRTTLVTGVNAGVTGQAGPYTFGPSVSLEMDRISGEIETSVTPFGVGHASGAQAEPYKLSIGGTAVIFTGEVGINLTEVLDLLNKITPASTGERSFLGRVGK